MMNKTKNILLTASVIFAAIFIMPVFAQIGGGNSFTDERDGKVYRTVKIGKLVWMAENLNYETDSSWCYIDSVSYCEKYGRLYVWSSAMIACPAGWRLPGNEDWDDLTRFVGGWRVSNGNDGYYWEIAGKKLKSKSGWIESAFTYYLRETHGNGTDDFGFSALPGGLRYPDDFGYGNATYIDGGWWSATENRPKTAYADIRGDKHAWYRVMYYENDRVYAFSDTKRFGHSVRCVMDAR